MRLAPRTEIKETPHIRRTVLRCAPRQMQRKLWCISVNECGRVDGMQSEPPARTTYICAYIYIYIYIYVEMCECMCAHFLYIIHTRKYMRYVLARGNIKLHSVDTYSLELAEGDTGGERRWERRRERKRKEKRGARAENVFFPPSWRREWPFRGEAIYQKLFLVRAFHFRDRSRVKVRRVRGGGRSVDSH